MDFFQIPGRASRSFLILASCLTLFAGCGDRNKIDSEISEKKEPAIKEQATKALWSGKSIMLVPASNQFSFPEGPGRRVFLNRCSVCHSLRYISMQPEFSKEVWEKEVEKMIKVWGAHITEAEGKEIVSYLTQIKGKKD